MNRRERLTYLAAHAPTEIPNWYRSLCSAQEWYQNPARPGEELAKEFSCDEADRLWSYIKDLLCDDPSIAVALLPVGDGRYKLSINRDVSFLFIDSQDADLILTMIDEFRSYYSELSAHSVSREIDVFLSWRKYYAEQVDRQFDTDETGTTDKPDVVTP